MPAARIQIVEDESIIALDIQNQLLSKGYQVAAMAASGEMAIRKALAHKPDLILMDIHLQGELDGIEAAAQIQAQLDIPVIYLTAYADQETLQRAKVTNPFGYLLKPFVARDLNATIQMALYRHEIEKKLRIREAQYRTLFEHSPDAVFVLVDGRIRLVNPAGIQMLGAKADSELIGRRMADMAASRCALPRESPQPRETILVRLDGQEVVVECTAVSAIYEGQDALQIVAHDITIRKQAEAAAQEQRALAEALRHTAARFVSHLEEDAILQSVLEVIEHVLPHDGSAILLLDKTGDIIRLQVSDSIAQKLDIQTTLQQHWATINTLYPNQISQQTAPYISDVNPDWAVMLGLDWIKSLITAPILSHSILYGFIILVSNKPHFYVEGDGTSLQALADQVAIALQNSQLYHQVQQHAAELERRVAQRTAELDQERGRLQAILDAAGEGIYFTDISGRLLYMNPAIERMTGYSWAELEGKTPHVWRSSETAAQTLLEMNQAYAAGQPWKGEVINRRKNGQLYDASLSMNPVRSRQGTLQGYVCAQRDITHLKELARLKDAFASQIGHELRTPITNIRLYHDLLARKPQDLARYMKVLQRETNRLENLVEGFIEISLLNADAFPIKPTLVDCGQVVTQLAQRYEEIAQQQQITLATYLQPDLPWVLADPNLLHQALHKLLENALHYTPTGGQVSIATAVTLRDGSEWITCCITDTGPGITMAEQPYLFERFYRGKTPQEFNVPGAGLGLPISHEIISKLGGHITLVSEPGQGAAFTVWLPKAKDR